MHAIADTRFRGFFTSMVDRKYKNVFLRAYTRGEVIKDDIQFNGIEPVIGEKFRLPEFLESFETKLSRKRTLLDDKVGSSSYPIISSISDRSGQMRSAVEMLIGATTSKSYFELEQSMTDSSESIPVVGHLEFNHIAYTASVDGIKSIKLWANSHEGTTTIFKESDANWLFFYSFAHHLESHPLNIKKDWKPKITIRQ